MAGADTEWHVPEQVCTEGKCNTSNPQTRKSKAFFVQSLKANGWPLDFQSDLLLDQASSDLTLSKTFLKNHCCKIWA